MKGMVFLLHGLPPFLARAGPKGLGGGVERMYWVLFQRTQEAVIGPPLHVHDTDIPSVQAQLR